jgi:hypothetical protein
VGLIAMTSWVGRVWALDPLSFRVGRAWALDRLSLLPPMPPVAVDEGGAEEDGEEAPAGNEVGREVGNGKVEQSEVVDVGEVPIVTTITAATTITTTSA